jgi:hypothetical protein
MSLLPYSESLDGIVNVIGCGNMTRMFWQTNGSPHISGFLKLEYNWTTNSILFSQNASLVDDFTAKITDSETVTYWLVCDCVINPGEFDPTDLYSNKNNM